jgi:hypothetical protein
MILILSTGNWYGFETDVCDETPPDSWTKPEISNITIQN